MNDGLMDGCPGRWKRELATEESVEVLRQRKVCEASGVCEVVRVLSHFMKIRAHYWAIMSRGHPVPEPLSRVLPLFKPWFLE